jgi:hypothetical protein
MDEWLSGFHGARNARIYVATIQGRELPSHRFHPSHSVFHSNSVEQEAGSHLGHIFRGEFPCAHAVLGWSRCKLSMVGESEKSSLVNVESLATEQINDLLDEHAAARAISLPIRVTHHMFS